MAAQRLRQRSEFLRTQASGWKLRDTYFTVYVARSPLPGIRLGITVSRRAAARAVVRNRVKRQVREAFRHWRARCSGLDIVVVAQPLKLPIAAPALRAALGQHWEKIEKRCNPS